MTPAAFAAAYGPLADQIAAKHPNLTRQTILAQWAVETGWGTSALAVNWHNLAGIRWYGRPVQTRQLGGISGKAGTGFAGYASLADFAADYGYVIGLPYYAAVRSTTNQHAQLLALGASPWDAGHYRADGYAGGSLVNAAALLPSPAVTPSQPAGRTYVVNRGDTLWAIAARFYGHGTLYPRIAAANHIGAPYVIHVGQRLVIP